MSFGRNEQIAALTENLKKFPLIQRIRSLVEDARDLFGWGWQLAESRQQSPIAIASYKAFFFQWSSAGTIYNSVHYKKRAKANNA